MKDKETALSLMVSLCMNHHLSMTKFKIARHKKTGNYYVMYTEPVIECTNGQEDIKKVLYTNGELLFCREQKEFDQKFEYV